MSTFQDFDSQTVLKLHLSFNRCPDSFWKVTKLELSTYEYDAKSYPVSE